MLLKKMNAWLLVLAWMVTTGVAGANYEIGRTERILLDTDVDTDDLLALLYLLKLNTSEFALEAVTISSNAWSNAGHAVNQIYDILYMMGREDIPVGVGGDGGILDDGRILPNVGGYLPIIEQSNTTAGGCRYRQAIPVGFGGHLDVDTNFGVRKAFLPQGSRKYSPLQQSTVQEILIDKISTGPISVFLTGTLTNFAIFLMTNPHLKKNVKSIYIMGGGVRSSNPNGCCPKNSSSNSCMPSQCGDRGNMFTGYMSNPYAEFNMFADPFAAYQVIHSGIPITLVPLDATNTIPMTKQFFETFEQNQHTYESKYCFQSLKMAGIDFMWDSFAIGIAISAMRNSHNKCGENEFAEMEYMNITVVTSNKPYGINDGSNPFFNGGRFPKFNLKEGDVHSGHVQTGLCDPLCLVPNGKGRCKDGYTEEVKGTEGVRVLVARKAKPNPDPTSNLNRAFFKNFLDVLNGPHQSGKFNFTTQFPNYKAVLHKPDFVGEKLGRPSIFDMDMSPGDFLALFYLLKVPVEVINIKAIIVSPTGWANAATIDVVYDLLHMMGRDDIPVGLGESFPLNQSEPDMSGAGDCKYVKVIPHGSGGFLDSDTLYGLAHNLPRSPRRYIPENYIRYPSHRDKEQLERRQPLALEVWESVVKTLDPGSKLTLLTNGPLTNLAKIIQSNSNMRSVIQDVYVVGGHINLRNIDEGNVITIGSNMHAEMNMFLDPLAAKIVFNSSLNITLIPLSAQRSVSSYASILKLMKKTKKTPEALFSFHLLSRLAYLQQANNAYHHMDIFLGEILGAVILAADNSVVNRNFQDMPIKVSAEGFESEDGRVFVDKKEGKLVRVVKEVDSKAYYHAYATQLGFEKQSAVIGSFNEQKKIWSKSNW